LSQEEISENKELVISLDDYTFNIDNSDYDRTCLPNSRFI
jgi:hypothetical protein